MREVNQRDAIFLVDHEIKLVEIGVYEAVVGQMHDEIHNVVVELMIVGDVVDLAQRIAGNELHHNCVTIEIDGFWYGKSVVVEDFHVGELFDGRQTRHVDPAGRLAVLQVVAFVFHLTKRRASESMEFEDQLLVGIVRATRGDVDVRLFAHADLIAHRFYYVA